MGRKFLVQALRDRQRPKPVQLDSPDWAGLLSAVTAKSWIRQQARELASSPCLLDRVAAVGLIGRLWSPCSGAEAAEHVAQILSGAGDIPPFRAVAWAKALPMPILEAIQSLAFCELDSLTEAVDCLQEVVASQAHYARDMAMSILLRRDDLESISFVLRCAGQGNLLLESLSGLDRLAVRHGQIFRLLSLERDERLWDVYWQEPLAWWAQI